MEKKEKGHQRDFFPSSPNTSKTSKKIVQACFWEDDEVETIEVALPPDPDALDSPGQMIFPTFIASESSPTPVSPDLLLQSLNARQKEAVMFSEGPLIVIGGPGTGKTKTLICRMAYRILTGELDPSSVLAIAFSLRAQEEMEETLSKMLPREIQKKITLATFYSLGLKILMEEAGGFNKENLLVLDEADGFELFRRSRKEALKNASLREIQEIWEKICQAKRSLLFPEDLGSGEDSAWKDLYGAYQKELEKNQAFDKEDLLLWAVGLLENQPQAQKKYLQKFHSIFIDEYQEINYAQYRFIRLLAPHEKADLTVTGDPDQSICYYRDCDVRYFLLFDQDYLHAPSIYLNDCYRASLPIFRGARQLTGRLEDRVENTETREKGFFHYQASGETEEGEFVSYAIQNLVQNSLYPLLSEGHESNEKKAFSFSDIAVLYPVKGQFLHVEEALKNAGIPFQKADKEYLKDPEIIKNILSLFRCFAFPYYDLEVYRLFKNLSKGVEEDILRGFRGHCQKHNRSFWKGLGEENMLASLPPPEREMVKKIYQQISSLRKEVGKISLLELAQRAKSIFSFSEEEDEIGKTQTFFSMLRRYEWNLPLFLREWALREDCDFLIQENPQVVLSTIHAAKGLEFPVVFILGCEEDFLSGGKEHLQGEEIREEEKRLFYVALTRAKSKVFLSSVEKRRHFSREANITSLIQSLNPYLERVPPLKPRDPNEKNSQLNLFD